MAEGNKKSSKKIVARIDPEMKELIVEYLKNRLHDLETIEQALEGTDFSKVSFIGHNIRGTGPGYGLDDLYQLGTALENAAKKQDKKALETALENFRNYIENLEIRYAA